MRTGLAMAGVVLLSALLVMPANQVHAAGTEGSLALTVAPAAVAAGRDEPLMVYVQVLAADGSAVRPPEPITVSLSSSNPRVAGVPQEVVVDPRLSYAMIRLPAPSQGGSATISAIAPGYERATATARALDPTGAAAPYRLAVLVSPSALYPGASGVLTVALVGDGGTPHLATRDMVVRLHSSGPVETPETLTISRGSYSTQAHWRARRLQGGPPNGTGGQEAVSSARGSITAQANGAGAGSASVTVTQQGNVPSALRVEPLLPAFLASSQSLDGFAVYAVDDNGRVAPWPGAEATATTSAPDSVLALSIRKPLAEVPGERPYRLLRVLTSNEPAGAVSLTVGAPSFRSDTVKTRVIGIKGRKLQVRKGPLHPLGGDALPATLVIQVVDEAGRPATFHQGYRLRLLGLGEQQAGDVSIPPGRSFVSVPLTGSVPERTSVTALAPGLEGDDLSFQIRFPRMEIALESPGAPIEVGAKVELTARVSSPAGPVKGAEVSWDVPGVPSPPRTTKSNADGEATLSLTMQRQGATQVHASASLPGYAEAGDSASVVVVAPASGISILPMVLTGSGAFAILVYLGVAFIGPRVRRPGSSSHGEQ